MQYKGILKDDSDKAKGIMKDYSAIYAELEYIISNLLPVFL